MRVTARTNGKGNHNPSRNISVISGSDNTNMLASDILQPRTVSSRGMKGMLDRLETDSPGNYKFKLLPPSALPSSFPRRREPRGVVTGGGSSHSRSEGDAWKRSDHVEGAPASGGNAEGKGGTPDWSWLSKSALNSPTGLALLHTKTPDFTYIPQLAIAPPFPIQSKTETTDRETLLQSIDPPFHVAIILIRYGYVAIAIAHDETIAVTKSDTRWVPNQHRAGGQSANRFKRSREKWAREFFDKSARLAQERFAAYPHHIDHLIFGGDQHVIKQFLDRATLPNNLSDRILQRRLNPLRPNQSALKDAVRQTWSSTIYELADVSFRLPQGEGSG